MIINSQLIKKFLSKIIYFFMFSVNKILGIEKRKVVFVSYFGQYYSDNPRAISEKLHELHPNYNIVWLFNNLKKKSLVPYYVKCVKMNSCLGLLELATAKFWVDNSIKPNHIYKSKKQVYIQTWHGDRGFKKILYDSTFISENIKLIESKICDLAISGSDYGDRVYRSAFRYNNDILKVGSPRNDILIKGSKDNINLLKKQLGISKETKLLLYAPTLRRDIAQKNSLQHIGEIDVLETVNELKKRTGDNWICMVRAHVDVRGLSGFSNNDKILDVTSHEDMSELLLISDFLITDYSSSAGDFALLNKPIVLFQADREEYLNNERTFYFDIDKSPYIIAQSQKELIQVINKLDWSKIPQNCKEILKFYGTIETGQASDKVVEYILSNT